MPFVSKAQQGYLEANKPGVAKKFEAHTPKAAYKKLPLHKLAGKRKNPGMDKGLEPSNAQFASNQSREISGIGDRGTDTTGIYD